MTDLRKSQLVELGAEKLADELLNLADQNNEINNHINWLLASHNEKLSIVKANIMYFCKIDLLNQDDYGVRSCILEHAGEFLSVTDLKILFDSISSKFNAPDAHFKLVELARQMKDVELFVRLNSDPKTGEVYPRYMLEIAKLCFESGNFQEALQWLDKIPVSEYVPSDFKKKLFTKLGLTQKMEELCWKDFFISPSSTALTELLNVIGQDQKAMAIAEAIKQFLAECGFAEPKLDFLIEYGDSDTVATYVISRWQKINGDNYTVLPSLKTKLINIGLPLAATLILRALLDSILRRKITMTYHHGAKYWHELAKLSAKISDWHDLPTHEQYCNEILNLHRRKSSFWRAVEKHKPDTQ